MFLFQALSCHPKYSSGTLFDPQLQRSPSHILCHNTWMIFFMALTSLYNYVTLCRLLLGPLERKRVCLFLGFSQNVPGPWCALNKSLLSQWVHISQVLQNTSPDRKTGLFRNKVWSGVCILSHVQLFATPLTVAHQAPLSMEFSRWEYGSGLPFPPPGDVPNSGIKCPSLESPTPAGRFLTTAPPGKPKI